MHSVIDILGRRDNKKRYKLVLAVECAEK